MATFQETLAEFDRDNKRFAGWQYLSQLCQCTDGTSNDIAYQGEKIAASLEDKLRTDDNFPADAITNESITAEVISYWESRIDEAKNILLRALYAGLVWYLKKPITHASCPIAIAQTYIETLIRIVTQDYMSHPIEGVQQAERAIKLSLQLKRPDLLKKAKEALQGLIHRHGTGDNIGIWGAAYRISQEYSNSYTPEEQARLIVDLEDRFAKLYNISVSEDRKEERNPWLLMNLADIIAGYYYRKHSPDKIDNLFEQVEVAFDAISTELVKLQLVVSYSQLHNLLLKYNLKDKAAQLSIKIAHCGEGIQDEMEEFKQEFKITKEEMDAHINAILSDDIEQSLDRFIVAYIPQKEQEQKNLDQIIKNAPFVYTIPQSLFDDRGRVKATIGNVNDDQEGHLILYISISLKLNSIYMSTVIETAKQRKIFTIDTILSYLSNSPAIKSTRVPIVKRGLEAYFCEDYLVAIHLLIPQIEEGIRNLLEVANIPTLKTNKSGNGFQLRILDDMLHDSAATQLLTDDLATYLRILLTDNRGWNLRNEICHGIADVNIFNKMTANRIIHALLCLGCFRVRK